MTSDGKWDYMWNAENRLIGMETTSTAAAAGVDKVKLALAYDSQGRRFQKDYSTWDSGSSQYVLSDSTVFLYDGWNLLAERSYDATPTLIDEKFYACGTDMSGSMQGAGGVGGLLAVITESGTYYPAYDGNGNAMAYVDSSDGSSVAAFEYGPFGELIASNGELADIFTFRFSTKFTDAETGLVYYGFRYYVPETGRWLNRDPIGERGGVNLYGMVNNNPVAWIDFLGLDVLVTFESEEDAAKAGMKAAFDMWVELVKSDHSQFTVEFGGLIGKHCYEAKWIYSGPVKGEHGFVVPSDAKLPEDKTKSGRKIWNRVGWYHTHYVKGYEGSIRPENYNPFSHPTNLNPNSGDTSVGLTPPGHSAYVIEPDGDMYKFPPGHSAYVIEPDGDMYKFPMPPMPDLDGDEEGDEWERFSYDIRRNPGKIVQFIGNIFKNDN